MHICVTGSSGFLGRFLCAELQKKGHLVTAVSTQTCDLREGKSLQQYPPHTFDQIFHLAAWTQAGDFCLKYPGEQWIINQKINTHVLSWWKDFQPQAKMICIGTSCAYDPLLPLQEDNYLSGKPIDSLFTYAMTKRMLLSGLHALEKQYELKYLYLIPSTLYGPGYHNDNRQMHFIFDLIQKIHKGALYHHPVILWGDGMQQRELFHVTDFVQAMLLLAEKEEGVLNIGAGVEKTIKEFACLVAGFFNFDPDKIQYDLSRYVGARSKCLDISRFREKLPHFTPITLQSGLKATIHWFQQNQCS